MALYLSAAQKSLKLLFANDSRYVIPSYQRPYSWSLEQCRQLFDDVRDAYLSERDSYFLGNIVLAEDDSEEMPEVVDGQQRLITLWLYLKALYVLIPTYSKLKRMIWLESEENDGQEVLVSKVLSNVFEVIDQNQIDVVKDYDRGKYDNLLSEYLSIGEDKYFKTHSDHVYDNAVAIYAILKEYFSNLNQEEQRSFTDFFISKIYLLPIILKDEDIDKARSNALMVFETINNRGMDLQDADIFKARLYEMSLRAGSGEKFIAQWKEINLQCTELGITIDDLFRYYYHIVRGSMGIVTAEKGLRDFFQSDPKSPFKKGDYSKILTALTDILAVLMECEELKSEDTRIAAWMQILYAYTNQYPVYALVCYLYFNKNHSDTELLDVLKKLIRYCYWKGSTTSVKFEIYNIIYNVAHHEKIVDYMCKEIASDMWMKPGKLTKGLSLLSFYMSNPAMSAIQNVNVDKIIKPVDVATLGRDWDEVDVDEAVNSLGNYIVLDMPKRSTPFYRRYSSYLTSTIPEVRELTNMSLGLSYNYYQGRIERIFEALQDFFVFGKGV